MRGMGTGRIGRSMIGSEFSRLIEEDAYERKIFSEGGINDSLVWRQLRT